MAKSRQLGVMLWFGAMGLVGLGLLLVAQTFLPHFASSSQKLQTPEHLKLRPVTASSVKTGEPACYDDEEDDRARRRASVSVPVLDDRLDIPKNCKITGQMAFYLACCPADRGCLTVLARAPPLA
jgi:hypothetical protein